MLLKEKAPNNQQDADDQSQQVAALSAENEQLRNEITSLRERIELFKGIFDCIPDALVIADAERRIQLTNPSFEKEFGYAPRELAGTRSVILYEDPEAFEAQGRQRFNKSAEEQLAPYLVNYRRKNGKVFTGETTGTPLRDGTGGLMGYLGAIRDVSEREQARVELAENEDLLRLIANSIPELVVYMDNQKRLKFVNQTAETWYNRSKEELVGNKVSEIFTEQAIKVVTPWIEKALTGERVKKRATITYPDGICRCVELSYVPDFGADGRIRGIVALVVDMTRQEKIEEELETSRTMLADAISAIPDGFAYFDREDRLQVFNDMYARIYPLSTDLIQAGNTFETIIRGGVERGEYKEAAGREEVWINERLEAHRNPGKPIEQLLANGTWLRIEERKTRDGGTVGIRMDITEAKKRELALEQMAVTDPLTGISNRRYFIDRIEQQFEKISRYAGVMSVLLIDADHFKSINDTYGHSMGDHVLKEMAGMFSSQLRGLDVVCRYGGEEFAFLLPETSLGGAFSIANRLKESVERHIFSFEGQKVSATISIGCSQSDKRDVRYEDVIERADRALYKAKELGRNKVIAETLDESPAGQTPMAG